MVTRRRLALSLAAVGLAACSRADIAPATGQITFAIPPTGPKPTLERLWRPVLADMQRATDLKVNPLYAPTFEALVAALKSKQADAGWFSNQTGLEAVRLGSGEVFARALGPNEVGGYRSVLVVGARSGITLDRVAKCDKTLSFGQGDPNSAAAYAAPIAFFFGPADLDPQKCFKAITAGDYRANLTAVAGGSLDVAASNSTFLALSRQSGSRAADEVKVIWASPTLPEDPILWRKDLDPDVKERLREFFFTYARGEGGEAQRQRDNLTPLHIGGFEPADDNHLLMAREIEARLAWANAQWSGDKVRIEAAKQALDQVVAQRQAFEGRVGAPAGTQ